MGLAAALGSPAEPRGAESARRGSYFIPRHKRLARLAEAGAGPEYRALASQARWVMAFAALLVLVLVFFMVVKP